MKTLTKLAEGWVEVSGVELTQEEIAEVDKMLAEKITPDDVLISAMISIPTSDEVEKSPTGIINFRRSGAHMQERF